MACLLLVTACKQSRIERETQSKNVVDVDPKDDGMNAAKARATKGEFLAALRSKNPDFHDFAIKQSYRTPFGNREHLWIGEVTEKDGRFVGHVGNEPVETKAVQFGESVPSTSRRSRTGST
jgi:uncharacterized protein YegJ (DUF2314 family)